MFHCNKRYGRHEGSPYELLVVPRDQVNKEYYTMTASGVVYCPGDANFETEFIPIGEWLRETSIYNLMRTLKFFKYYFTQKMFRIWRKVRLRSLVLHGCCVSHVINSALY